MPNKGYIDAINLSKEKLIKLDPEEVVKNTGAIWNGSFYTIPWYNDFIPLDDGNIEEKVIWYHYLLANGPKKLSNKYITYKQVPGAAIYNSNFILRAINPMVKAFKNDLDLFLKLGISMGGTKANLGHAAFTLNILPYIPLTYILWEGDEEVVANGNILFDETSIDWFCAEDLVVIASLPVYKMLHYKNKSKTNYFEGV